MNKKKTRQKKKQQLKHTFDLALKTMGEFILLCFFLHGSPPRGCGHFKSMID